MHGTHPHHTRTTPCLHPARPAHRALHRLSAAAPAPLTHPTPTPRARAGSSLTGNGLLVSDGEVWRRQRRLSNPAFRRVRVRNVLATGTSLTSTLRIVHAICVCLP